MELDYEKDMYIDETFLDVEWLEQSSLAGRYIKNAIHMRKLERRASEVVKTTRSELINNVNQDPQGTTGKSKPNSADIEAHYRRDEEYKKVKDKWIQAEYEASYAEMAQKEISYGRRTSLENLVTLHGDNYFAGPKVPHDLTKAREEKQKQSNRKVQMGRKK